MAKTQEMTIENKNMENKNIKNNSIENDGSSTNKVTLIGYSTTIIGFGLCGIKDIHEVTSRTAPEDILSIIEETSHELIMIDQEIYDKIEKNLGRETKTFIKIPDRYNDDDCNDIDRLVKDTLGITIKKKDE